MTLARRRFLAVAASAAGALFVAPRVGFAQTARRPRFLFVIQRGAADGLNTVVPVAEPAYAALRGPIAIDPAAAHRLDGTFALHPSLERTAALHAKGEALFVHAVATPYRERSHFDGQNVLETGDTAPGRRADGWMNRLIGLLPQPERGALALSPTIPLALRGPARVASYAASRLPQPTDDLLARVTSLYEGDAQLHGLWSAALDARAIAGGADARADSASLGALAARFLSAPDGPSLAMVETGGWDTHGGQNARLANGLRNLDALLGALADGLGSAWADTTVLVATEFGRTAAVNGTGGTDHGTGAAAMLLGGAVKGGRVIADWPGLGPAQLFEGRDLAPTTSLDMLAAGALAGAFRLDPDEVARTVFMGQAGARPVEGLMRG